MNTGNNGHLYDVPYQGFIEGGGGGGRGDIPPLDFWTLICIVIT